MKDPIVILPENFDVAAAWGECREWVDRHEPGRFAAAAGADPGCVRCPACREYYWAWGTAQRCSECSFEFPTDWWPMYSKGVQDRKRIKDGEATGGMLRRRSNPYYREGFDNPPNDPFRAKDDIDWSEVAGNYLGMLERRYSYCERCGQDKEGRRARSSQECLACESKTTCRHMDRSGPWDLSSVCKAGVRLGDLIDDQPGWVLKIPCRYMAGGCPVACDKFAPKTMDELQAEDDAAEASIARTLAAMTVVPEIKQAHKGKNWSGTRVCPVCDGTLHLSHAASNGHVHGRCETDGCVAWME